MEIAGRFGLVLRRSKTHATYSFAHLNGDAAPDLIVCHPPAEAADGQKRLSDIEETVMRAHENGTPVLVEYNERHVITYVRPLDMEIEKHWLATPNAEPYRPGPGIESIIRDVFGADSETIRFALAAHIREQRRQAWRDLRACVNAFDGDEILSKAQGAFDDTIDRLLKIRQLLEQEKKLDKAST